MGRRDDQAIVVIECEIYRHSGSLSIEATGRLWLPGPHLLAYTRQELNHDDGAAEHADGEE